MSFVTNGPGSETRPQVVVTLGLTHLSGRPDLAARRNDLYVAAVERHGANAIRLDTRTPSTEREGALATMDGLLMSGGADIHPADMDRPSLAPRRSRTIATSSSRSPGASPKRGAFLSSDCAAGCKLSMSSRAARCSSMWMATMALAGASGRR